MKQDALAGISALAYHCYRPSRMWLKEDSRDVLCVTGTGRLASDNCCFWSVVDAFTAAQQQNFKDNGSDQLKL
jgi:hypothetical protein